MLEDEYTVDELYEMVLDQEKLKSYQGFKRALAMGVGGGMAFYDELPYDEIKQFIAEEREGIFSKIPEEVLESNGVVWEHVGSTSIKGMPGTIYPDSLIMFNKAPAPREIFNALMDSGFTFLGSGPFHPTDLWFLKKISREGPLDNALFKLHLTPCDIGPSKMLLETRDRCNSNPEDFEDYKSAKVEAAKHLASGNIMAYKGAKGASKLINELAEKYNCKPSKPPAK